MACALDTAAAPRSPGLTHRPPPPALSFSQSPSPTVSIASSTLTGVLSVWGPPEGRAFFREAGVIPFLTAALETEVSFSITRPCSGAS